MPAAPRRRQALPDCIVIGAGVFGLWAARHALKRGERVLVLEKRHVGAGASGGFLGALMPHMPDRWNAKKQMQYEGLVTLPLAINELEDETGLDCGYRRCGRLLPLKHEKMLLHLQERRHGAEANWVDADASPLFTLEHVPPDVLKKEFSGPLGKAWLNPLMAPFGAGFDTLSARVNPRDYLAALAAYVRGHPKGEIREAAEVTAFQVNVTGASVTLSDGTSVDARRIVVANGYEAYLLLKNFDGGLGVTVNGQRITGRGVKGQAVLLDLPHLDNLPIVYDSGSYIVPHGKATGTDATGLPNRIAVGSTSVDDWLPENPKDVDATDEHERTAYDQGDTGFLKLARQLCPALEGREIAERWANIRPRNTIPDPVTGKVGTEPVFGAVDDAGSIYVAAGGFKISFALAHLAQHHPPDNGLS